MRTRDGGTLRYSASERSIGAVCLPVHRPRGDGHHKVPLAALFEQVGGLFYIFFFDARLGAHKDLHRRIAIIRYSFASPLSSVGVSSVFASMSSLVTSCSNSSFTSPTELFAQVVTVCHGFAPIGAPYLTGNNL